MRKLLLTFLVLPSLAYAQAINTPPSTTREVSAQDFAPSAGGGTADDTAAVQAAFNSGKPVFLIPGTYSVTCLTVPSGLMLRGAGPAATKIVQRAGSTCATLTGTGATDVSISGVTIDANGAGVNAVLSQTSGARWRVFNNTVRGSALDCIRFASGTDTTVSGNTISGCGQHGITWTSSASKFAATDNNITPAGGAGVIFSVGTDGSIKGNTIANSGPNGDCITGYHTSNLRIAIAGNSCLSSNNNGIHVGGTQLTVTGNNVYSPSLTGIFVRATTTGSSADPIAPSSQVSVTGNNVYNTTTANQIGIFIGDVSNGSIAGNVVMNATQAGILIGLSSYLTVSGNSVGNTTGNGIHLRGTQNSIVAGNLVNGVTGDGFRLEPDTSNGTGLGTVNPVGNTISSNSSIGNGRDYIEAPGATANYYAFNNSAGATGGTSPAITFGANSIWNGTAASSSDLQLATAGGKQVLIKDTSPTTNYIQLGSGASGIAPTIQSSAGSLWLSTSFGHQVLVTDGGVSTGANYIQLGGGSTGTAPLIKATGSDANRNLVLQAQGSGVVQVTGGFYASSTSILNTTVTMNGLPTTCTAQPSKTVAAVSGVLNLCP